MGMFDWIEFDEGSARFSGGVRGCDELGHETFALEVNGAEHFGEIKKIWPDSDHFNLEVLSFGHNMKENVGMPMNHDSPFIKKFSESELQTIQSLILSLVQEFAIRKDRPFIMNMDDENEFLGKVFFVDGWALIDSARRGSFV